MDTTITLVVDWNEKTVHVDGTIIELDDLNVAEINVSKILEVRNMVPSVLRLQHELERTYIKEQIVSLFKLWGKSNTFTLRSTMDALNVDRHEALVVLKAGIDCDVLVRGFNSAWKVESKIIRESMRSCVNNLVKDNKPARNAEELLKENMERMKKEHEQEQEQDQKHEKNQEELEEYIEEEPMQIKVGMKGTAIREEKHKMSTPSPVKNTSVKLSTLVSTPAPIQLPKKKPVKPHKPAKK